MLSLSLVSLLIVMPLSGFLSLSSVCRIIDSFITSLLLISALSTPTISCGRISPSFGILYINPNLNSPILNAQV